MPSRLYMAYNGAMPTTAAAAKVTTGTVIKTLMQLSTPATLGLDIVEWGISFDGNSSAVPGACELIDTAAINATMTTGYSAANDLFKFGEAFNGMQSQLTTGTANSGFTATAEGTITATREHDLQLLPSTAPYLKQFPLERGPAVLLSEFERIRVTFAAAINALCYIVWAEA